MRRWCRGVSAGKLPARSEDSGVKPASAKRPAFTLLVVLTILSAVGASTAGGQCTAPVCQAATCFVNDAPGRDGSGCYTAIGGWKTIQDKRRLATEGSALGAQTKEKAI
jgi:hypothetical protein